MNTILYLHHVSSIGGGSYCLLNMLKEVDQSLLKPMILLQSDGPLVREIDRLGIEVFFLPSMVAVPYNKSLFRVRSLLTYLKVRKSLKQFKKFLEDKNIDIVYINNMMLYPYLKVAKQAGIKTIQHVREHWPLGEHRIQLEWVRNVVYKYADRVVAINHYSASMFPNAIDKTTIVYDWIDFTDRYAYMPYDKIFNEDTSNLKVCVFTGGVSRIKGTLEVIKGFSDHLPYSNYRLLILGGDCNYKYSGWKHKIKLFLSMYGYNYYYGEILKLIKNDSRIVCIPNTYAIKHLIQQAYCYISYYTIPHANLALAESIILKTVCVAASTPESLEYSNNGSLALLFDFNNNQDFCSKLDSLTACHSKIKDNLKLYSSDIEKLFDRKTNLTRLESVYYSLLSYSNGKNNQTDI